MLVMEWIHTLFGTGRDLNSLQMVSRAIVSFLLTLVLIRIAGIRTFGKRSAFDNVIVIMLGSIFSRVVVGASPFIPTTLGCLAFVLVHSGLGWISVRSDVIGRLVKGERKVLYAEGKMNERNMRRVMVSQKDLMESVRLRLNSNDLGEVQEIVLERNGEISVIRK
jgi:uncharacterized membrane protein YcaP (DUF421 family)